MPEEPNMTPEEIDDLFREVEVRVAGAAKPQTNGVPNPQKNATTHPKKKPPAMRKARGGTAKGR